MKKKMLSLLLALVLTLSILAVPSAAAGTPSSWAQESVSIAISKGLVPTALQDQYTQPITRREFCLLADTLYTKAKGSAAPQTATFSDTTDPAVLRMASVNVIQGVGNGAFNPNGQLTREQAATMLARLADALGKPLAESAPTFADSGSVSSWAKAAVGQMQKSGIMGGTGNNRFSPAGSYTREQSIATILRVYDLVNGETASGTHAGTRSDPLDASKGATVTYNDYSFEPTRQFSIKVLQTFTGAAANYVAELASSANDKPAAGEEYVFFEVEVKYLSSSKGEDDPYNPRYVVDESEFFAADGSALSIAGRSEVASNHKLHSYTPKSIYPGGTITLLTGALVHTGYDEVLLRVPNNSDRKNETNTWVHMNAGGKAISTVDAVNAHFGLEQETKPDTDTESDTPDTSETDPGSRANPLDASAGVDVTYYFSSRSVQQMNLKVLNTITGAGANYLGTKTTDTTPPASNQEWLFFEVALDYISSSEGMDSTCAPYMTIFDPDNLFNPEGTVLDFTSEAWFLAGPLKSYSTTNEILPGSHSTLLLGVKATKGYGDVLLRIKSGSDAYTWVRLNDAGSTMSTVSAVKSHFGLDGSTPDTDPKPETPTEPETPKDPKEYLSFLKFDQEYGPFTMKNYQDVQIYDKKPDTNNSVTSFVFTGAEEYNPGYGYPVTMRIKGTSGKDSISFWLQAYGADGNQLCQRIVTVSDGITAGQPYDVTVTGYFNLAAPQDSHWSLGGDQFNDPSKVVKIGLMGGTYNDTIEYIYFDTSGKQVN